MDLGYLVNPSGLFYDDKYFSSDKQREVGLRRTIVSRTQLRVHFMQKALILLITLRPKGGRCVGP